MWIIFYLLSIVSANVITSAIMPLEIGVFLIPAGTFLIGATFVLRDFVQERMGRKNTYGFIFLALVLSAITSYLLANTLTIVIASAISFVFSEASDTEIYTRLNISLKMRVFFSGIVGGLFDSTIFVIVGLSPLGAGFIPWEAVPMAIAGQIIVKFLMQALGVGVISFIPKRVLVGENNAV